MPSILYKGIKNSKEIEVLNLVISGMPSILGKGDKGKG